MRPTALLLHGFTQTSASWAGVVEHLDGELDVLAPDLPGHGAARGRRPASLEAVAGEVAATAGGLAGGPVVLCGYSMGGRIALRAALDRPDRFARVVLVGASPGIADAAERAERRRADEALAERFEASSIERIAREWAAQPLFADQPEAVRAAAHQDRLRNDPRALAAALRVLGTGVMEPLWDRLSGLEPPVSLVVGERDGRYREIAERMAGLLPAAGLVVVPGAGHAVQLEAPGAVAAVLAGEP
jgi:2-succinyl-6-hydroxy-2,4-cyclohexadiene-1-carboxylate synthase